METPSASRVARALTLKLTAFFSAALLVLVVLFAAAAHAASFSSPKPVSLGTAEPFAVLAGTAVTNTGPTVVTGDLGVSPGTSCTGLPAPCTGGGPGIVHGTIHKTDAVAASAQSSLTTAYVDAAGRGPQTKNFGTTDKALNGQKLIPGIYGFGHAATANLTTTLTLDAQGDPNAVWIFQASSDLVTGSSSRVALINAAQSCHVYWQVTSSATLGTSSTFRGDILALTSITVTTGVTVDGRVLARNGAVTLDTDTITVPACRASSPTPTATPGNGGPTPTAFPGNGGGGQSSGPVTAGAPYGNTGGSVGGSVNTSSAANGQSGSSGFPLWLAILLTVSVLLAGGGASGIVLNRMHRRTGRSERR
ncbi:MAG TPA: ice-binding family protein [Ktedonobacterales bacterium]|nr:ice-binding family protein [Ktedonobacterales bacterium]